MKKMLSGLALLLVVSLYGQAGFTMLSQHTETPNTDDSAGVFCRTFYDAARDKFYTVYCGRQGTSGPMNIYRWREYNSAYTYTGVNGILPGVTSDGDFAMQQVGTEYYHISASGSWDFKLSRFDEDFNLINSVTFTLDSSDSRADMLLNYCNGHLVIGAMHVPGEYHPTMPMQTALWQPVMHKWEYDLNLNQVGTDVYLSHVFTTWGASCIYNNNTYNIVTMRKWPQYSFNVYRYDTNWNYVDSVHLNIDGQWSQSVIWDGTSYFVAYHSGNEHRAGNITVAAFDASWNLQYDTVITSNPNFVMNVSPPLNTTEYNANRPYAIMKGDTLVISYDVDSYQLISYSPKLFQESQQWQAHVDFWRISSPNLIAEPQSKSIALFPNPADDQLYVNGIVSSGIVSIYDVSGKCVMSAALSDGENVIDISSLAAGCYTCIVETGCEKLVRKVIRT